MESGQFVHIFSSWEVIASCLLLMFLLPLVFFVASARSPVRRPAAVRVAARVKPKKPPREKAGEEAEDEDDLPPSQRQRRDRGARPSDEAEEK
jgi:hypothetical protein